MQPSICRLVDAGNKLLFREVLWLRNEDAENKLCGKNNYFKVDGITLRKMKKGIIKFRFSKKVCIFGPLNKSFRSESQE